MSVNYIHNNPDEALRYSIKAGRHAGKHNWELSEDEFVSQQGVVPGGYAENYFRLYHRQLVRLAIDRGLLKTE